MEIVRCVTDEDYEAWRQVRIAVIPYERTQTVAEMRANDTAGRLLVLAKEGSEVVGCGLADRSDTANGGFVMPRVRPEHRRKGVGTGLLQELAAHVTSLGVPEAHASVDDEGSLAFATRFGFEEVDREVEQVRELGDEPEPGDPPEGIEVIALSERPELWAACYERFGKEVLSDFALYSPLEVTAERWQTAWIADPMFLALADGEVVGCAGFRRDEEQPHRAENALTAVRRDWRGRGLAAHLKRVTMHAAVAAGISELYTWTQDRNTPMRSLNEKLGYRNGLVGITVARSLPL